MGLFPQSFLDDLRMQADILRVVQDRVSLKRAGTSYKGLCPFHAEKGPSFHVHADRGFFHCFGCGVGGDVFRFVELYEKVDFPDAVRLLAERFGLSVPESQDQQRDLAADQEREALLKMHEIAAAYFREQLEGAAGARAQRSLQERGLSRETIDRFGYGLAPPARDDLRRRLEREGFGGPLLSRSGLIVARDDGSLVDRFRNRLMIPICRESGSVIAFGGRAMDADQEPKYLNSPETAVYTKGRTLYGLHVTKAAIRRLGYAVLVEGYFDLAQAYQAGVTPVVASCGTALTALQARTLRRLATKVVISFDPDTAGQTAAARSSELLMEEGFQVNVAMLPGGADPDTFIRAHGAPAYVEKLRTSRPYLEYLLDRAAEQYDFGTGQDRRRFLSEMLRVAARIPDAATRDQFADRLAHKARVTEEVVRAEIRKAAVQRRIDVPAYASLAPPSIRPAETGLLWGLMHAPAETLAAMAELAPGDFDDLATAGILRTAQSLAGWPAEALPDTLLGRLTGKEADLVASIARQPHQPAPALACAHAIKRLGYERQRAEVQREIDRLQELGAIGQEDQMVELWRRKKDLAHRIEALGM